MRKANHRRWLSQRDHEVGAMVVLLVAVGKFWSDGSSCGKRIQTSHGGWGIISTATPTVVVSVELVREGHSGRVIWVHIGSILGAYWYEVDGSAVDVWF